MTYADFAKDFTADFFNASLMADIVHASGARYFVITSKHHEGFTMWPSKTSFNWNSVDVGPKLDILGLLFCKNCSFCSRCIKNGLLKISSRSLGHVFLPVRMVSPAVHGRQGERLQNTTVLTTD